MCHRKQTRDLRNRRAVRRPAGEWEMMPCLFRPSPRETAGRVALPRHWLPAPWVTERGLLRSPAGGIVWSYQVLRIADPPTRVRPARLPRGRVAGLLCTPVLTAAMPATYSLTSAAPSARHIRHIHPHRDQL